MASNLVRCFHDSLKSIDRIIFGLLGRQFPPGTPCFAVSNDFPIATTEKKSFTFKDILENSILWAVPKSRRTIEKRLRRKFGHPDYVMKILKPKKNLLSCNTCGHHHEAGMLCPHCYEQVIEETKAIQEKIQAELGLSPVEQDVVVLYDNERSKQPEEFWQGKRIVEMKKDRPQWFSKNLMERSTQQGSESNDVKPTDLA